MAFLSKSHNLFWHFEKALFSASLIILVEKIFLQFVAISFHRKALADRLAENRLGLKALDRLSNAQPVATKKSPYIKKGHKSNAASSVDFASFGRKPGNKEQPDGHDSTVTSPVQGEKTSGEKHSRGHSSGHADRKRKRRKAMTSIIVDQVGTAISQVTLKNSKFNRDGELGGLSSARRLARKLFGALSDVTPHRSHLVVEGKPRLITWFLYLISPDFHPYFRSTSEAVSLFFPFWNHQFKCTLVECRICSFRQRWKWWYQQERDAWRCAENLPRTQVARSQS